MTARAAHHQQPIDGVAIIYCEGAFGTPNGKTAHGLVRFTERYAVRAVVDSEHDGQDAGWLLDGKANGIPVCATIDNAIAQVSVQGTAASHLVVGLAPDGGRLSISAKADICYAMEQGLNVDSGLHDFLSDDPGLVELASRYGVTLRDVRKPPPRDKLRFFTGKIDEVTCLKVAVLGTDSAVGKRTTAWQMVFALRKAGYTTEMIGTGQTAWLQGARYCVLLDSLVNDFVTGEIEHAAYEAWRENHPDVIVIEGQGSLLNPAYPGGFEILAAARPDAIVLQHAPARQHYDGFPGYAMHPLGQQIHALETIAGRRVSAIAINHEGIPVAAIESTCRAIESVTGLPTVDVLVSGADAIVSALKRQIRGRRAKGREGNRERRMTDSPE
jgi:uncharacterized NAD-dependent epimerase/dehydratase family protein